VSPTDLSELVDVLQLDLLARLCLAVVLGGLIGLEREWAGKPAGLRTNILICLGSALFTEVSISTAFLANAANEAQQAPFRADPARIAANIVTGVGFLGGGAILRGGTGITGLTTAATIWVVSAVGMAVGAGAYVTAIGTTALVLFILFPLRRIERYFAKRFRVREKLSE
jgi:putative Mg2+ transporter-C (MgtC) family protein